MVVKSVCSCVVGILCFLVLCGFDGSAHSIPQLHKRSTNNDDSNQTNINNRFATSFDVNMTKPTTPSWMVSMLDGTWYGAENYMKRKLFTKDPSQRPMVCYSNATTDKNGTVLYHFICPMADQKDSLIYCCGKSYNQHCCTKQEYDPEEDEYIPIIGDIDVVTGVGLAVGFVISVSLCLALYCCCCQRRPEIQDGIKLMWVRRSFGKELNKLDQPMCQNQLQVAGRSTDRGSRSGSRNPSRKGSRNASNDCTPSVSRRGSYKSSNKNKDDETKGKLKVPGGVTITLTTPSDEQGPTNPLLKQTQERIDST